MSRLVVESTGFEPAEDWKPSPDFQSGALSHSSQLQKNKILRLWN